MKTQMRFQKWLFIVSLVVAALTFVYALSYCGGTIYEYGTLYLPSTGVERVPGAAMLFAYSQMFCEILIALSIVFILIIAANYITGSHARRNYYVTNYITNIAAAVYAAVVAILIVVSLIVTYQYFAVIDVEAAKAAILRYQTREMTYTIANFIIGYILAVIVLLDAVAIALNLVWKIKLMKGEKQLLQGAVAKEVA